MPLVSLFVAVFLAAVAVVFLTVICVRQRARIQSLTTQALQRDDDCHKCQGSRELLFSINPHPMWTCDRKTLRFLQVNDAAVNTYGYSRDEFLAMTLADIRPAEDIPAFMEAIRQPHIGYTRPGIFRHRRKDGSTLMAEVMAFQYDKDNSSREMVLALDVTERCRMEQALRESEAGLKALIDNAPFGIAQGLRTPDRLQTVNPALLSMLGGYSLEEARQLSVPKKIYADPKERERLLEVLTRSGRVEGWETNLRRRDGTLVPVRMNVTVTGGGDSPEVFSSYIEDMTQQTRLEQQVRQVQKLEAVGRLAGGMAHDFNNILVIIKLSTDMMLEQITPDSPFSKPLLQISSAADRAATLTRQMLAFSRQQMMQPRVINLNSVVSETTQMLRRVIGEDIELVTNLGNDVENSRLDPDQVTQVILNLAVNARDAMPQGGTLQIETDTVNLDERYAVEHPPVQPGRYVMLAVTDNGSGIDKAVMPRIFDPFFTTKEVGKGTGLGLSIVYGIVKQSGGYVWVYSEPGQGTTFKLYFPAIRAAAERLPLRADGAAGASGQVVLVVEDEPLIRSNLRECLQNLGYRMLEAESGTEALQVCNALHGQVDLLLTDLVMTGQSGRDLATELRQRYPGIRVLFMSGYTEDTASRRDILQPGSPFLQKPFSVADLAKAVREALVLSPAPLSD
jgi:two-component system, cell cycle sensor histidine kinase and response regulator CckA